MLNKLTETMQQKLFGSLPEPLLVANVYRPTNYGDMDSLLYVGLHAIIIYTNCMHSLLLPASATSTAGSRFFTSFIILGQKIS